MSVTVQFQIEGPFAMDEARLRQAVQVVAAQHPQAAGSEMSIVITDNGRVRALNKAHRGLDAPTDVLSFPAEPLPPELNETPYLGDLVIAYPYAQQQAQRAGHALADSLALLVVHGTLHLLGYDHDTPERRAAMWAQQEAALVQLGISPQIVPPLEG